MPPFLRSLAILLVYLAMRFVFNRQLDALGPYGSYVLELGFVGVVVALFYRSRFRLYARPERSGLAQLALAAPLGWLTYKVASWNGIAIPFDLGSLELLLFLTLIGPVLEELVFRQALWHPIEDLVRQPRLALLATSALFSFGHFYAYFFVPEELKTFVLYQTAYTLGLGLWWGQAFSRTRALALPIGLHIVYNTGFWLGSLY